MTKLFKLKKANQKKFFTGFTPLEIYTALKQTKKSNLHTALIPQGPFRSASLTGFTLLEMVIAGGIFSILAVATVGITLSISNAHLKIAGLQTTQDNVRFGLELITKEMRTGSAYQLSSFCAPAGREISFDTAVGDTRVYYWDTTLQTVMRIKSTICTQAIPLFSEEISVESVFFQMRGQIPGPNDGQPMITISMAVKAASPKLGAETKMNLQTTIVQRIRDL